MRRTSATARPSCASRSRSSRRGLRALLAAALVLPLSVAFADDVAPLTEEQKAEAIERHVERGWSAFRKGRHEDALTRMERLAKLDPEHALPPYLTARVKAREGKYEEALALATDVSRRRPDDRAAEALRFDLLQRLGRFEQATTAAEARLAQQPDDLVARTTRGLLFEERGRRKEALEQYDRVIEAYNRKDPPSEELPAVAQAAIRAHYLSPNASDDLLNDGRRILQRRLEKEPTDVDARLLYADVTQANRGSESQAIAGAEYTKILKENTEVAEARVGRARIALLFYDQDRAVEECQRALVTNPNLVSAMSVLAFVHVGDGDYDKADAMWSRASAVNPLDKEARSVRAARLLVSGKEAEYASIEKAILEYDPTYGRFYTTVAALVGERQRRYDVAATLTEKAIAIDPGDASAHVLAGVNLMNLGREQEARKRFEEAYERSKQYGDVQRENYLQVLDVLETFVESRSKNFVLRQHGSEAAVMETYLLPLLEQARTDLGKKYGWEPKEPVLVESFHRHDDFSVRSVGSKNIPAVGVCLGLVITLDGPFARDIGSFSWARTAWHEYAHVVTLGISRGQVPRWLTEGLSVHEEKAKKAEWGRESEAELHDRWKNGRLLKMADINGAFRTPDILFAYFQGGLIADYLTATRGFEVVPKMLARFAEDVTTERVFREELGIELADFDERFSAWVGTLVGGYKRIPRWDDRSRKEFAERTKASPEDAEAWVRLAWADFQRGIAIDAGAALEKALALSPDHAEVILLQGQLAMASGRGDLAKGHFDRFLAAGHDDVGCRLALARMAKTSGDSAEVVRQYEAAKACFPRFVGKGNPYVELAKLYRGEGKVEKAVAELEAFSRIANEDFDVRRQLATHYKRTGNDAGLLRVSQEMIEIHPFGADRKDTPDLDLHRDYAEALLRAGRKEDAAREWKVQTLIVESLPEQDRSGAGGVAAYLAYAALLVDLGREEEALEAVYGALRIDPESVPAKALKERLDPLREIR